MLFAPLESILNRNLAGSAAARELLRKLNGKVFAVDVTGMPLKIYFRAADERLAVMAQHEGVSDAVISGSPLGLAKMIGAQPESSIRTGSVRIEGDAETAQAFRDLLAQARPEFEEELSRIIGDVAAHQVGRVVRGVLDFGRRTGTTFTQNVGEYLQEEGRDLPTRPEMNEFLEAVDHLRDDVERAAARLALLERRNRP